MTDYESVWKAGAGNVTGENPRIEIAAEIRKKISAGTDRQSILDWLGQPEGSDERLDRYALGRSEFGVSFEFLVIYYDEDGKTIKAQIERQ
ncbi:MAG: hypothetical protein AAGF59_11300 [Pseudomonadota bacterium]